MTFLRRTDRNGAAELLGRRLAVDPQWPNRALRVEVDLTKGQIRFYRLRRREPAQQTLVKTAPYQVPTQTLPRVTAID